jgi:hypothetical protein
MLQGMSGRLQLSLAGAASAAALTIMIGMTGAQAGTVQALSTPAPSGSTPNTSPFPPSAPTNLTATQVTTGSVTLSWTASTPGCCAVEGYDIMSYEAFNDVVPPPVSVGNVTTVTITNSIRPGKEYRFWVSARDGLGHRSASSNSITVVTPVATTGDTTPPPGPHNLTAGEVTATTVRLSWTAPADTSDVVGYNVYSFDGLFISNLLGTTTDTAFTAPIASAPLRMYYVRARDAAGNVSAASNTISVNPGSASPSTNPLSCRVVYTSQSQWTNGFVAGITITNTGQVRIDGWTLTFTFGGDQRITALWGGSVTQSGATIAIRNASWNAVIEPGASVTVGFQAMWSGSNTPPTAFFLNGVRCST